VQLPSRVERWMCPNHIEQVIDNAGIIKSIRLSERIKAYEDLQKEIENIDEIDLLTTFTSGRGFRFGSKFDIEVKGKPKIKVPDAVIRMYKFPMKVRDANTILMKLNFVFSRKQRMELWSWMRLFLLKIRRIFYPLSYERLVKI